jgi:hypothetical protein
MVYYHIKKYYLVYVVLSGIAMFIAWGNELGLLVAPLAFICPLVIIYIGYVLWLTVIGLGYLIQGIWKG